MSRISTKQKKICLTEIVDKKTSEEIVYYAVTCAQSKGSLNQLRPILQTKGQKTMLNHKNNCCEEFK